MGRIRFPFQLASLNSKIFYFFTVCLTTVHQKIELKLEVADFVSQLETFGPGLVSLSQGCLVHLPKPLCSSQLRKLILLILFAENLQGLNQVLVYLYKREFNSASETNETFRKCDYRHVQSRLILWVSEVCLQLQGCLPQTPSECLGLLGQRVGEVSKVLEFGEGALVVRVYVDQSVPHVSVERHLKTKI